MCIYDVMIMTIIPNHNISIICWKVVLVWFYQSMKTNIALNISGLFKYRKSFISENHKMTLNALVSSFFPEGLNRSLHSFFLWTETIKDFLYLESKICYHSSVENNEESLIQGVMRMLHEEVFGRTDGLPFLWEMYFDFSFCFLFLVAFVSWIWFYYKGI